MENTEGFKKAINEIDKIIDGSKNNYLKVSASLSNWIIASNTGLLGLGIGTIKLLNTPIHNLYLLYLSWICSITSLSFVFTCAFVAAYVDKNSSINFRKLKNSIIANSRKEIDESLKKVEPTDRDILIEKIIIWQYPLELLFLLLSFITLAFFAGININREVSENIISSKDVCPMIQKI